MCFGIGVQRSLRADPISTYSFPHLGEVLCMTWRGDERLEVQTWRQPATTAVSTHAGTKYKGQVGKEKISQRDRQYNVICTPLSFFLEYLQLLFLLLLPNALMHYMSHKFSGKFPV